jgi:hypothetical protein
MHLFKTNILICDTFYVFWTREFIFRKKVVYTGMVQYVLHTHLHDCLYNWCIPEDEPLGSKHVEDIN